jgi:hypothetical protein
MDNPGEELTSALLVPYNISEFVNRDLIFRGEITSVENVSSTLTYKGEVQGTYEESLLTVRVDEVYTGNIPDEKEEIVLYCPASNKNSNEYGHALSKEKGYVFFTMPWNDELLSAFDDIGYSQYGYDKHSDAYLPSNIYSLFAANGGYVIARPEWAEVIAPPQPEPPDALEKLWPSLIEGYGAKDDLRVGGSRASTYSNEDFRKTLEQLQERY